jgi:phospholipid/cholesterol/gamma-HCH transport system substrate-binding protein
MRTSVFEVFVGAVVIMVALVFLVFAYNSSRWQGSGAGVPLLARFERIDGLFKGTDVRVSGVKVGTITGFHLDAKTYMAHVEMQIDAQVNLPIDTIAEIASEGILGAKYLALIPGVSPKMLLPGAMITRTQSAMNFESLIGKFLLNSKAGPQTVPAPSSGAPQTPAS